MPPVPFDPNALSNEDLRAAIAVARERLPHDEVCEHCAYLARTNQQEATTRRRDIAEFNDRAAVAGYLIPSKRTLVHRWDCPSMQAYLREVEQMRSGEEYEENLAHGYDLPLPAIANLAEARAFIGDSKARRGCRTCAPDL